MMVRICKQCGHTEGTSEMVNKKTDEVCTICKAGGYPFAYADASVAPIVKAFLKHKIDVMGESVLQLMSFEPHDRCEIHFLFNSDGWHNTDVMAIINALINDTSRRCRTNPRIQLNIREGYASIVYNIRSYEIYSALDDMMRLATAWEDYTSIGYGTEDIIPIEKEIIDLYMNDACEYNRYVELTIRVRDDGDEKVLPEDIFVIRVQDDWLVIEGANNHKTIKLVNMGLPGEANAWTPPIQKVLRWAYHADKVTVDGLTEAMHDVGLMMGEHL